MKQVLTKLASLGDTRELYDPLREETYVVEGEENQIIITKIESSKSTLLLQTEEVDEAMRELDPVYERFKTNISAYLDRVKEGTYWRFFDVSYGVDIHVRFSQEEGWQVWMAEDLSLQTADPDELKLYIRGLITDFESWWMNEFRKFHEKMQEHGHHRS